jgi:hypothetical protein
LVAVTDNQPVACTEQPRSHSRAHIPNANHTKQQPLRYRRYWLDSHVAG